MNLHPAIREGTPSSIRRRRAVWPLLLLGLWAGCSPWEGSLASRGERVEVGDPSEWHVVEPPRGPEPARWPAPPPRAPAVQAWRKAPTEDTALSLAQALLPEFSWAAGAEHPAQGVPPATDSLQVRLPSSADGDVELASGPHVFHTRSLDGPTSPASRQLAGALFYGPRHFRAAAAGQQPSLGSSWHASRLEEGVVLEDSRAPWLARYEVKVPASIRAVRDAGMWLEFLDERGIPALRLHYPLARDGRGLTRQGRVTLQGLEPQRLGTGDMPLYRLRDTPLYVEVTMSVQGMEAPILIATAWSSPDNMAFARREHTATLLASGRLLVIGGRDANGNMLQRAEVYDPITRQWSSAGDGTARAEHTATLLTSGRVLVAGGCGNSALASAELYDPNANAGPGAWTPAGNMPGGGRCRHTATLLPGGKVLIAGGSSNANEPLASAVLYDPAGGSGAGAWTFTGILGEARYRHTATLLSSGKVLVAGGTDGTDALPSAEVYDPGDEEGTDPNGEPVPGAWAPTGSLAFARSEHTATILPSSNGKVLVVGGTGSSSLASAELYDPAIPGTGPGGIQVTGGWTSTDALTTPRTRHTATLLPSGRVLVTGGSGGTEAQDSAELYEPSGQGTDTEGNAVPGLWTVVDLLAARESHTATLLPSGKVLVAGGLGNGTPSRPTLATCQEFDPPGTGVWANADLPAQARTHHTATLLANGTVLVTGGLDTAGLSSAQVYDPAAGTGGAGNWSTVAAMDGARLDHTATLLQDGRVLVVGGRPSSSSGGALNTARLYQPGAGWSNASSMGTARYAHTATLLNDGRVLVVGGQTADTGNNTAVAAAELYDPAGGTPGQGRWVSAGTRARRTGHTATLLSDGRVLVVGGRGPDADDNGLGSAELYNPTNDTWSSAGAPAARFSHTATLLPNGQVLVVGGRGTATGAALNTARLYNPSDNSWTSATQLTTARFNHTATLLPSGKVLIAGGRTSTDPALTSVEIYDPLTTTWAASDSLSLARYDHTATLLPSGRVIIFGGENGTTRFQSGELYDGVAIGTPTAETRRPLIEMASPSGRTFTLQGLRMRGFFEGSSGNQQSSPTNFPVAFMSRVDGSGLWRMTVRSFAPGTPPETVSSVTVDAPPEVADGHYLLFTLVNAISGGRVVYLDTTPPGPPAVTAPAGGSVLKVSAFSISGTADPESTVTVFANGTSLGTAPANSSGAWSRSVTLADGSYTVRATARDAAGNTSPDSAPVTFSVDATPPPAPAVTAPADGASLSTQQPSFSGTAEVDSTVTLTLQPASSAATNYGPIATTAGSWSFTPPADLDEDTYTVTATATDAAGNTGPASAPRTLTLDVSAPAAPVVQLPAEGAQLNTPPISVSGTAEAGSTVTVFVNGTSQGAPTATPGGTWSLSLALPDGSYAVTATARDAAGNPSGSSSTRNFRVDTRIDPPVVTAPANGSLVNIRRPVFRGTAEPGSSVTLSLQSTSGTAPLGPILVDGSGNWSLTTPEAAPLSDGQYTVTATAEDPATNTSEASAPVTFTVDATPPAPPAVTSPANNAWVSTQPVVIRGNNAEAGSTVTVSISSTQGTIQRSTTDISSGEWSVSLTLSESGYTVSATARDAAGNTSASSASIAFTVDTTAPAAPVILEPMNDRELNTRRPTFSGTAELGSTVTLTLTRRPDTGTSDTFGPIDTDTSGRWSFTLPAASARADGSYAMSARARDQAGNEGPDSAPTNFTVDTTPPDPPAINTPGRPRINTRTPTFSGTSLPGTTVTVFAGTSLGSTTTVASGAWNFTVPTTPGLDEGSYTITATARDAAGNTSDLSDAVSITVDLSPPAAPAVTSPADGAHIRQTRPTFSGTAEADSNVTIFVGGAPRDSAVAAGGNWSITVTGEALAEGEYTVTATATDQAGNIGPSSADRRFTVDTRAPNPPVVNSLGNWVNTRTPTLNGTAEANSTVNIYVDGNLVDSTRASGAGDWSYTVPATPGLSEGLHNTEATATDLAGNTSSFSAPITFNVDVTRPGAPAVTRPANGAAVNTIRPTFEGTAEENISVKLYVDGLLLTTTATSGSGSWSYTISDTSPALSEGVYTVTATATDRAGNTGPASASSSFRVDTTPPPRPVVTRPDSNVSPVSNVRFAGSADANSTITLRSGSTLLGTTTTSIQGQWGLELTLLDSDYTVTITATDAASNTSPAASVALLVDTQAPGAPTVRVPGNDDFIRQRRPTFSGRAEPNALVRIYINGQPLTATIRADATDLWTYTHGTDLQDGTYTVNATATDRAENTSPFSGTTTFTVDATPPAAPLISLPLNGSTINTNRPVFSGTAEPSSTVRIFVNNELRGSVPARAADGFWEFPLSSGEALPTRSHTVTATATDRAGNVSPSSATTVFTVDTSFPPAPTITSPATVLTRLRQRQPTFQGTAMAGSTLIFKVDETEEGQLTLPATPPGTVDWSFTMGRALPDAQYTLIVGARNSVGNVTFSEPRSFIIDATPPDAPTIELPAVVGRFPVFQGSAEPDSTVNLIVNPSSSNPISASPAVVDGRWRFELLTPLIDATHSVQATATDLTGNVSATTRRTFSVDTTPPQVPVITSPSSGQLVNTARPPIRGTADLLSTVRIFVDGSELGTATTNDAGEWSFTWRDNQTVSEGSRTLQVSARDSANNESSLSQARSFTVDSIAPGTPEVTTPGDGSSLDDTRPSFAGKADANSIVTLTLRALCPPVNPDSSCVPRDTTLTAINVPDDGEWSFRVSSMLRDGDYQLEVIARDAANNFSVPALVRFTVDTQVPDAPRILSPSNNETLSSSTPTFRGDSVDPGSTVFIFVDNFSNGFEVGSTTTSPSGTWGLTLTNPLSEGPHTLRVRAVDPAGNISPLSSPVPFSVDTVVPGVPRLTSLQDGAFINDTTPTLSGTAEAGSTIIAVINNSLVLSTQATLTSTWSTTPDTPLAEGTYTLVISSRDSVGNTNPETQTVRFTVDTTAPDTQLSEGSPRLQDYPPTATFEFSSSEQGGTFECSYNGADFAPCTSPHVIENVDDGAHSFRVRALDKAGNVDSEPVEYKWSRDLAVMEGGGCGTPGGTSLALPAFLALLLLAARLRSARAGRGRWSGGSLLLVALLALGGAPRAQAEEVAQEPAQTLTPLPAVDLERLYLNPGRGTLLVGGGELLLPGTFRVALGGHYQSNPLRMRLGAQRLELISHRVTGMLSGAVGVLPWLELNVHVPVVPLQRGQDPSAYGLQAPASQGLGTPMAHARMGILSRRAGHLMDLAVDVGLGLPLGSTEALAREPIARLQGFALAGRRLGPVRVAVDGGLLVRVPAALGPANLTQSYLGQELRLGVGVSTVGQGLQFEAALRAALALETAWSSAELLGGIRYPLYGSWLEVFAMGGVGLGSLPGTPGFRVVAGVSAGHPPPPETPVTRRASSWQQPLLREDSEEGERPQPLRAPPTQSDDEP